MIRETVRLLLSSKKNTDSYLDIKILNESVKISQNIMEIKNQVQTRIDFLS